MSYFDKKEKIIIFSEHDWNIAKDSKKLSILKSFEKEIARNLGIKSKPQLLLSQNTDVLGSYSSDSNTLEMSEPLALKGREYEYSPFTLQNSNMYALYTICHELAHVTQYQRIKGKLDWNPNDDKDGITINMLRQSKNQMYSYIKGTDDETYLYYLQPAEYEANKIATREVLLLIAKYQDNCSQQNIEKSVKAIQRIQRKYMNTAVLAKTYRSDNIVRDISFCLQNLFLGKQYPVPSDLMRDIEDACHKSYELVHSPRYQQLELRLKKEIKRQLAAQECER